MQDGGFRKISVSFLHSSHPAALCAFCLLDCHMSFVGVGGAKWVKNCQTGLD